MNTGLSHQESATIYQFPAGGRSALGGRRYGESSASQFSSPRISPATIGGSWYHEEAIAESKKHGEH